MWKVNFDIAGQTARYGGQTKMVVIMLIAGNRNRFCLMADKSTDIYSTSSIHTCNTVEHFEDEEDVTFSTVLSAVCSTDQPSCIYEHDGPLRRGTDVISDWLTWTVRLD